MFDSIREMSENLAEMGLALAGRALSGVFGVVRDVAIKVEEHTGIPVPFAHSGMPVVVETAESQASWEKDAVPSHGDAETKAASQPVKVEPVAEPASETKSGGQEKAAKASAKGAAKKPAARKSAAKKTTKKTGTKSASSKTSKKGKKSPGRNSQVLRLLDILSRDTESWMTAVELSAATAEQGSRILPGNVRKAIRLRAEGLIESRTRPGSKRGATEYRITEKGLAYLKEHK